MITPERLEAYLRKAAALTHEVEEIGHFQLFFDPDDPLRFSNYAKPTRPVSLDEGSAGWGADLERLIAAFEARERLPRFEFTEEYAPGLPAILRRAGFEEEARQAFMVCEAAHFRAGEPPPGLIDPYPDYGFAGRGIAGLHRRATPGLRRGRSGDGGRDGSGTVPFGAERREQPEHGCAARRRAGRGGRLHGHSSMV